MLTHLYTVSVQAGVAHQHHVRGGAEVSRRHHHRLVVQQTCNTGTDNLVGADMSTNLRTWSSQTSPH